MGEIMLKLSGKATVKSLVARKEFDGEGDAVRAITVRLAFEDVGVDVASAFVGQLGIMFDKDDDPLMPELAPLGLLRELANVAVEIGGVKINGADVNDVAITLKPKRRCSIDLKVNARADDVLDALHRHLGEPVKVKLIERQAELAKLEGGLAPEPA
jgi:hypothetical protein